MNIITPAVADPTAFVKHAVLHGYGMQEGLIQPEFCAEVSDELANHGQLYDFNEMRQTRELIPNGMLLTSVLHRTIEGLVQQVDCARTPLLSFFNVRVFPVGEYATTIHRNDDQIGPWALGVTLKGTAPFEVYDQSVLPQRQTIHLKGDGTDPTPTASMNAGPGSVWVLYTENEQRPHSGGRVISDEERELLILYNFTAYM